MKMFSLIVAVSVFVISFPISATTAVAQDEQDVKLPALVISATRYEMPQDQVSSDITVITKEDIAHLPVHDLSEALNYITGLVINKNGGPGSSVSDLTIQGSGNPNSTNNTHIKISIDDIPLDTISGGTYDLSQISLEHVDRVEVLKGAASSVWGGALGGVINIVTRKPTDEPTAEAGVSAGERNTMRYTAAISGKVGGTGYFLSGSRLESDGFFKNQAVESNNVYVKLSQDLTKSLRGEISYNHFNNIMGFLGLERPSFSWFSNWRGSDDYGRVKLDYAPDKDKDLSLSIYKRYNYGKREDTITFPPSVTSNTYENRDESIGAILKGGWRHSDGVVSAGAEASNNNTDMNTFTQKYSEDKRAAYINETYTFEHLTMNAGVRHDIDDVFGSETSPSAGLVYDFKDAHTLLRLNVARGFAPPPITFRYSNDLTLKENPDLRAERCWTYQAGVETKVIPGLWTKVTLYEADISDALDQVAVGTDPVTGFDINQWQNFRKFIRKGIEVETKTNEYMGLSLSYAYSFNDIKNDDTGQLVNYKARVTHDIGLDYRGPYETRTTVKGHYIYWNGINANGDPFNNPQDQNFLWDAKVSKYLAKWKRVMGEVFVSIHNLTDAKQYQIEAYPNPGRWVEAGVSLTSF